MALVIEPTHVQRGRDLVVRDAEAKHITLLPVLSGPMVAGALGVRLQKEDKGKEEKDLPNEGGNGRYQW